MSGGIADDFTIRWVIRMAGSDFEGVRLGGSGSMMQKGNTSGLHATPAREWFSGFCATGVTHDYE